MSVIPHIPIISTKDKNFRFRHKSPVIWLTGLSGSGKSTIANELEKMLFNLGIKTHVLDGDNIRLGLNKDLSFSNEDRTENVRRISEVAKLFSESGTLTIVAAISPFSVDRETAKTTIGEDNFIETYIKCDLETCQSRDPKGLYKKADGEGIKDFTGISSNYEVPTNPEIIINTELYDIKDAVHIILGYLLTKEIIQL